MKKTYVFICLFILLVTFVVGCGNKQENTYLKDISYEEFCKKIENKETFILEVVQTGCANCTSFTPKFTEVLEEHEITAYSLNLTDMEKDEDRDKFLDEYNVTGTPTVIFFKDGEETSTMKRLTGDRDKNTIIKKLKANDYIED